MHDVRSNRKNEWIRIHLAKGDLIVIVCFLCNRFEIVFTVSVFAKVNDLLRLTIGLDLLECNARIDAHKGHKHFETKGMTIARHPEGHSIEALY